MQSLLCNRNILAILNTIPWLCSCRILCSVFLHAVLAWNVHIKKVACYTSHVTNNVPKSPFHYSKMSCTYHCEKLDTFRKGIWTSHFWITLIFFFFFFNFCAQIPFSINACLIYTCIHVLKKDNLWYLFLNKSEDSYQHQKYLCSSVRWKAAVLHFAAFFTDNAL